ncbi:MAG: 4Fe-4S binding protein [Actinomycetota bacterium]
MSTWHRVRDLLTSRWFIKTAFFLYFVFACVQLMRFAAWTRGLGPYVARPESPAGLLPVGHFTSFFALVRGGGWDVLLPAGLVIIIGALAVSLLLKRGFCGWICPLGTFWDAFALAGQKIMGRNVRVPKWLDYTGRGFRYLLTALIVFALLVMVPVSQAVDFRSFPYMWVADIKTISMMIRPTYLLVVLFAGILSFLFGPVWCRYLCPVGGVYSVVGELSPCKVRRNDDACTHCLRCDNVCHAFVAVEKSKVVNDTECDGCMECVKICPADDCLEATVLGRTTIAPWVWPLLVVGLWLAIWAAAYATGNWKSPIPPDQFRAAVQSGVLDRPSVPDQ